MHLFWRKRRLIKGLAARSLAGFIRAVKKTSRTIHEPHDLVATLSAHVPFVMAMWHGQFMMLADLNTPQFDVAAMVSRHTEMLNLLLPCWSNSGFPPFAARVRARDHPAKIHTFPTHRETRRQNRGKADLREGYIVAPSVRVLE